MLSKEKNSKRKVLRIGRIKKQKCELNRRYNTTTALMSFGLYYCVGIIAVYLLYTLVYTLYYDATGSLYVVIL